MKSLKVKVKRLRPLLGTFVAIELQGEVEQELLNEYITAGFEAISQIDRLMSYYRFDSDLTRLNLAKAGELMEVHPCTLDVLKISNELFQASDGIFDIRCGSVLAHRGIIPSFSRYSRFHSLISEDLPLEVNGTKVRKTGPWIFDLGGIAKGYAVDYAVKRMQYLSSGLVISGVVNAGGDLRKWGNDSTPMATRIYGETFSLLRLFQITSTAVATSSVRASSDSSQGLTTVAHVMMPSGKFIREAKTVTVFGDECFLADALTKIVLLGSAEVSNRCLSSYGARALVFAGNGHLERAIS
ncbi:MAG: FAD:protein FMN transferase [Candidatus Omnitrophica bacterium]|nr:FAD:protein FMN transferase [Candidatus Omnitrophota bacterium]